MDALLVDTSSLATVLLAPSNALITALAVGVAPMVAERVVTFLDARNRHHAARTALEGNLAVIAGGYGLAAGSVPALWASIVLTLGGNYTKDSKTFATDTVSTDVFSSIDLDAQTPERRPTDGEVHGRRDTHGVADGGGDRPGRGGGEHVDRGEGAPPAPQHGPLPATPRGAADRP